MAFRNYKRRYLLDIEQRICSLDQQNAKLRQRLALQNDEIKRFRAKGGCPAAGTALQLLKLKYLLCNRRLRSLFSNIPRFTLCNTLLVICNALHSAFRSPPDTIHTLVVLLTSPFLNCLHGSLVSQSFLKYSILIKQAAQSRSHAQSYSTQMSNMERVCCPSMKTSLSRLLHCLSWPSAMPHLFCKPANAPSSTFPHASLSSSAQACGFHSLK